MKRFVQDVQEVWLTNLGHLREHQPEHMYASQQRGHGSGSGSASEGPGSMKEQGVRQQGTQDEAAMAILNHEGGGGGAKFGSYKRGQGLRDRYPHLPPFPLPFACALCHPVGSDSDALLLCSHFISAGETPLRWRRCRARSRVCRPREP